MRFKSFEDFSKRYKEEAKWLNENRGSDVFASDMYDHVCAKLDLSVRQRKQIRKAATGGAVPSGTPRVGDTLKGFTVSVYRVHTHEDRGDVRFVFHHPDGWGGRFLYDEIVHGRMHVRNAARKNGHDERSFDERQSGARSFQVTILTCNVAWTGGNARGYVVLDDVEIDKTNTPSRPKPKPKPATPANDAPPIDFGFDDEDSDDPDDPDVLPSTPVVTSERGAPIPDMSDWAAKFRG